MLMRGWRVLGLWRKWFHVQSSNTPNQGNRCDVGATMAISASGLFKYPEQCYHHYVVKTYSDIYKGKDPNIVWPNYELWCIIQSWRSWYLDAILCKCQYNGCVGYNNFVYAWARTRCNLSKGKTLHQVVQSIFLCAVFYMIIGVNCGIIYVLW